MPEQRTNAAAPPKASAAVDVRRVQRRTLAVLLGAQVIGAFGGLLAGAVGALVAARVMDREGLAGLVQSGSVLGAAMISVPAARLSLRRGRRAGLTLALGLAAGGATLAAVATQAGWFWLLLLGSILYGGGPAAGLQARFAATDLEDAQHRGRALGLVMWGLTVGAVAGPNLAGPAADVADGLGAQPLAGPYVVAAGCFVLAAVLIQLGLRPDPWLLARDLAAEQAPAGATDRGAGAQRSPRGVLDGLRIALTIPSARLALAAIALAHTAMVSVMVMTPIHMDHGGATLELIGLVISVHVAGMFAFSPVMGWLADRMGRTALVGSGGVLLVAACTLSALSPQGSSPALGIGLLLLGLGWSAVVVASSTLLVDGVPMHSRVLVQGASDVTMNLVAALGGAVAGVVVAGPGYAALAASGGALAGLIVVLALLSPRTTDPGTGIAVAAAGDSAER